MFKVQLLEFEDNGSKYKGILKKLFVSARNCYSSSPISTISKETLSKTTESMEKFLKTKILDSGHLSVVEHENVSIGIDNAPLYSIIHFLRHRHLSFSQKSFRYIEIKEDLLALEDLLKNPRVNLSKLTKIVEQYYSIPKHFTLEVYDACVIKLARDICFYLELTQRQGVAPEDARTCLSCCLNTSIVITGNFRTWIELSKKRLCKQAQKVTRDITTEICNCIAEVYPVFKDYFKPNCASCKDFRKNTCKDIA